MQRELVVLGTASQVPTRHRNHNGYFLRWGSVGLLFDPGEGTQRQMTRYGVRTHRMHHIFVSHFHGDHCLGLAGVVQRISLDAVPHPVTVHYPASGQVYFDRLRHASIFEDHAHIVPQPVDSEGVVITKPSYTVTAGRLKHRVPSFGYRIQERDGHRLLPERLRELGVSGVCIGELVREGSVVVDGRRVGIEEVSEARPGQSMAFVMDTSLCEAAERLAEGVDLLVCESTFLQSEADLAEERGHMTALQAAQLARSCGARRLVLTHFSQRYPDNQVFLDEARGVHDDVVAAYDGLVVPVPARADARVAGGGAHE